MSQQHLQPQGMMKAEGASMLNVPSLHLRLMSRCQPQSRGLSFLAMGHQTTGRAWMSNAAWEDRLSLPIVGSSIARKGWAVDGG